MQLSRPLMKNGMIGSVDRLTMDRPENDPNWVQQALKISKGLVGPSLLFSHGAAVWTRGCEKTKEIPGRLGSPRVKGADPSESVSCVRAQEKSWLCWRRVDARSLN